MLNEMYQDYTYNYDCIMILWVRLEYTFDRARLGLCDFPVTGKHEWSHQKFKTSQNSVLTETQ